MAGYKSAKRVRPGDDDSDVEVDTKPTKTSKKAKTNSGDVESGKDADGNSWWSVWVRSFNVVCISYLFQNCSSLASVVLEYPSSKRSLTSTSASIGPTMRAL